MPWEERSTMTLRREFVELAGREGANVRELCRRYGGVPTAGYKVLAGCAAAGEAPPAGRSRPPRGRPARAGAVRAAPSRLGGAWVAGADGGRGTGGAGWADACRRYGLPGAMLADKGPPWGTAGAGTPHTPLTVWLLRLGVAVGHGRAYHPQ